MTKINYKSDFDFIATLNGYDDNGNVIDLGFPQYDWKLKIKSSGCGRTFIASYIDGVAKNCYNDDGKVHIVCDGHGLEAGVLTAEFISYIPNSIYSNNEQLVVTTAPLGITLVAEGETTDYILQTELQLPIIAIGDSGGTMPDMTKYLLKEEAEQIYAKKEDMPKLPTDIATTDMLNELSKTIPTKVSDLDNDKGYATTIDVDTAIANAITNTLNNTY